MTSPDAFFTFFKILVFWVVRREEGVKGKNGPKWQKNLSHWVSQELYHIWLWFLVHMCKMMIYLAIFFHFLKILIFQVSESSSITAKSKNLKCAPPSSCVCDFFKKILPYGKNYSCEDYLLFAIILFHGVFVVSQIFWLNSHIFFNS